MKYTKFFLWALLALTLCLPARAQDEAPEPDEKRHWEVGIDLLPLLDRDVIPLRPNNRYSLGIDQEKLLNAASVFARYHFSTKAGRELAFRLRIGFNGSVLDTGIVGSPEYFKLRTWGVLVKPGIEWQRSPLPKLQCYWGTDLSFRYGRHDLDYGDLSPAGFIEPQFFTYEVTLGLHGFFGATYQINRLLSVSAESSLEAFLQQEGWNEKSPGATAPVNKAFFWTLRPLSSVYFSFNF